MTNWSGPPALGKILARLASLTARVERIRVERQRQHIEKLIALTKKNTE